MFGEQNRVSLVSLQRAATSPSSACRRTTRCARFGPCGRGAARHVARVRPGVCVGRPSVPPERLLRAQLLQIFYSIRSERLLMEQLEYDLLFRWFVGLEMDEPIWSTTVFTKNRDRLPNQETARSFFRQL